MITRPALHDLKEFISQPSFDHLSYLIRIPSLYMVAKLEAKLSRCYSPDFLAVLSWLVVRTEEVLKILVIHETPEMNAATGESIDDDWKKVSAP